MTPDYFDYINWEYHFFSSNEINRLKTYWETCLANAPIPLKLPIDSPKSSTLNYFGDVYLQDLSIDEWKQIKEFSQTYDINLFVIFLTVFSTYLSRLCQQNEFLIGVPLTSSWLDNQSNQNVVGMLANLVVCRMNLERELSFRELLQQVNAILEEAKLHRDYPFVEVAKYLTAQQQETDNTSPVPVAFSWEVDPAKSIACPDETLSIESYSIGEQGGGAFEIYLTVIELKNQLQLCWKYDSDLFQKETIARFAKQFQTLLLASIAEPEQPVNQLPLISYQERHQLLTAQIKTAAKANSSCIHQLIEAQVNRCPEQIAVVFQNRKLTYRELNQAANQAAHYLGTLGIGPETLVGIFMPRSTEMIVALLGILKAGAAYVPIDPNYPYERVAYMLADSQVSVLLAKETIPQLPDLNTQVIDWDAIWETIAEYPVSNPLLKTTPQNLAYVIYTSGSTGKPKGVMIEHRSLVNFAQQASQEYRIAERDRVLQFASFSFDAAAEEIYTALISGAALVLRPDNMLESIPAFLQICNYYAITVLDLPTAYWHLLVETLANQPQYCLPSSIRCVIIGGERANPYYVEQWQHCVGHSSELINTYGPTEATVVATAYRLPSIPVNQSQSCEESPKSEIPIGKPLGNIEAYILDEQQQLVSFGEPGELYLGGVALARGYLNRPELTRQYFIPDSFRDRADTYLYKTGDMVRYLPDGNLEFLGRVDQQVKIRGFRVDMGEIESTVTNYPGIQQTFVMAQLDKLGHQQIVAYVVSDFTSDRVSYEVDCYLEYDQQLLKVKTSDISSFGVRLQNVPLNRFQQGDFVQISFSLPEDGNNHWFAGKIVWQQQDRIGIQLQPIAEQQLLLQQSAEYLLETQGILKALQRALIGALRQYLKRKLPDYMIPASFVLVNALPLTPNGKVDRRSLPSPQFYETEPLKTEPVLPRNGTEQTLAEIWSDLVGIAQIALEDNFFELGGNSLLAIQCINRISEELQVDLSVGMLVKHPTISSLASAIIDFKPNCSSSTKQFPDALEVDLQAEASLDPAIQYPNHGNPGKAVSPSSIFLTGPTGFVGPYLLSELLQQTDADIYCLIRYHPQQTSRQRIETQLKSYSLWKPSYRSRIIPIVGDLGKPRLGLSEEQFQDLAHSIDVIYHNGAWVNFVYPYTALREANVQGTQEVLRLASYGETKPVHFVSTLSVFSDAYAEQGLVLETEIPQYEKELQTGYEQSKWVAEQLVREAQRRGLTATIHRLGTLLGDSQTGIANKPHDFFFSLIRGCLQLRKAPYLSKKINLTPVDYASKAIVSIAQKSASWGKTFHNINPRSIDWTALLNNIQENGYCLEIISFSSWLSHLKEQIQAGYHNDLATFLPILNREEDLRLDDIEFDATLSQTALFQSSLECPDINVCLIGIYLNELVNSGNSNLN